MRFVKEILIPYAHVIGLILLNFVAVLSPMGFTVGVISSFDTCSTHNRFIQGLDQYGKTTSGTISYRDEERDTAGVDYLNAQGQQRFGILRLSLYPLEVRKQLEPGNPVQLIYIDKLISEADQVVLAGQEQAVRGAWCVPPEYLGIMAFFCLMIILKPQIVFAGFIHPDILMQDALGNPLKGQKR